MSLFEWSSKYSVGVEAVDRQHRGLIDAMNELNSHVERGHAAGIQLVALNKLIDLTVRHFAAEEHAMQRSGYDGFVAHKRHHERLLQQVKDLHADVAAGQPLNKAHMNFFKTWLSGHIIGVDKKYGPALLAAGAQAASV